VWRVLADPYSYHRWVKGTAKIRAADPGWPAAGSRLYHRFGPPLLRIGDSTTVLAVEREVRLILAARAWPFGVVSAELTLHPVPAGTRIVLREVAHGGLVAWFPRLGRAIQQRRLRRSVRALARLCRPSVGQPTGIGWPPSP
jgi:hypothetical protein